MVYTVENAFLMGQQLPPARAGGVGVMREIVLCHRVWRNSPVNEDLLLLTGEAFTRFQFLEAEEEGGLTQNSHEEHGGGAPGDPGGCEGAAPGPTCKAALLLKLQVPGLCRDAGHRGGGGILRDAGAGGEERAQGSGERGGRGVGLEGIFRTAVSPSETAVAVARGLGTTTRARTQVQEDLFFL